MDTVVDNDLILKSVSYGLADIFWPGGEPDSIGILGAARYVVRHEIDRAAARSSSRPTRRSTWRLGSSSVVRNTGWRSTTGRVS
jgi:hypothetical protein